MSFLRRHSNNRKVESAAVELNPAEAALMEESRQAERAQLYKDLFMRARDAAYACEARHIYDGEKPSAERRFDKIRTHINASLNMSRAYQPSEAMESYLRRSWLSTFSHDGPAQMNAFERLASDGADDVVNDYVLKAIALNVEGLEKKMASLQRERNKKLREPQLHRPYAVFYRGCFEITDDGLVWKPNDIPLVSESTMQAVRRNIARYYDARIIRLAKERNSVAAECTPLAQEYMQGIVSKSQRVQHGDRSMTREEYHALRRALF